MDISSAIRNARKGVGMTQAELASRSGISARAVWEVENGGGRLVSLFAMIQALDFRVAGLPRGQDLGGQIRTLRKRRGWTQADLALRAGISKPTVIGLERNQGHVRSLSAVLAVLAPKARERKPEQSTWHSGGRDSRWTPPEFMEGIYAAVGEIGLDPCGHPDSPLKARRYYYQEDDGLSSSWLGSDVVFMNPPFSQCSVWIDRAHRAWRTGECNTVIALLPVRTHTKAFQELVAGKADVIFLRHRVNFINSGQSDCAPFGCMLVIWGSDAVLAQKLMAHYEGTLLPRTSLQEIAA